MIIKPRIHNIIHNVSNSMEDSHLKVTHIVTKLGFDTMLRRHDLLVNVVFQFRLGPIFRSNKKISQLRDLSLRKSIMILLHILSGMMHGRPDPTTT